jgi:hypothetical protein
MHQRDEDVGGKERTQAICNRLIQKLQQDTMRINKVVNLITTMEPCLSKHKLREYDYLLMQNTIMETKHRFLQL